MADKLLVIAGPTAVGKTEVALRLAEILDAEIVSADSMQVYRRMDIGTAKPNAEEQRRVRHHLLDILSPGEIMTAADYQGLARAAIAGIASRGRLPILSGGTGLYIRAAIDQYNFMPLETDWELRRSLRSQIAERGPADLHGELAKVDPLVAQRIHPNDERRIVRALEVFMQTGRRLSEWESDKNAAESIYDIIFVGLTRPRAELYQRVDQRVEFMFSQGLIAEVRALSEENLGFVARQALGYKELLPYLTGEISLEQAKDRVKTQTRRYAKRQLSWFRADRRVLWVDCSDPGAAEQKILSIVAEKWQL